MPIRLLLVDDHSVVLEGLRMFLKRDKELVVIGEAANGLQAIHMVRELHPDVVLMDLRLPVLDGISATATIKREYPETEVIAFTSVLEGASIVEAVRAGAIGYLLKDTQAPELRKAIKAAATGQVQLSEQVAAYLMREVQLPKAPERLTEREIDVLRLLAKGKTNKEIANNLLIVEETVKTHVRHILSKLGAQSRTQAVLYAMRLNLILPDER